MASTGQLCCRGVRRGKASMLGRRLQDLWAEGIKQPQRHYRRKLLVVGALFTSVLGEEKGSAQHQGDVLLDDNEGLACALAGRKMCFFSLVGCHLLEQSAQVALCALLVCCYLAPLASPGLKACYLLKSDFFPKYFRVGTPCWLPCPWEPLQRKGPGVQV